MGRNINPIIDEAVLRRGPRPLVGSIVPGEVFAWEPDLPHARQLCVVSRIEERPHDERLIWSWDIDYRRETWNEEGRFREAVVRTLFKPFPTAPMNPLVPIEMPRALQNTLMPKQIIHPKRRRERKK